jgi:undecaprenyl-diphosphatase
MTIEIIKAILLGIVEGITEWLPISSTGHMILVEEFIQLNMSEAFKEMFFVVIQLGAILAVALLYFNKLNPFSSTKTEQEKINTFNIWFKVLIGVIPAGVIGVVFGDWLNDNLYNYQTVAITLILYGVLFIIIENRNRSKVSKIVDFDTLSFKTAFLIGCFQVLSLVPGTSRSGATILGGIILGTSRSIAAEFSFFLSIPVMFGFNFTNTEFIVLVTGMLTAFLVSIIAIQFLLKYIKNHDFKVFGWYRIVLGAIVLLYFGFK